MTYCTFKDVTAYFSCNCDKCFILCDSLTLFITALIWLYCDDLCLMFDQLHPQQPRKASLAYKCVCATCPDKLALISSSRSPGEPLWSATWRVDEWGENRQAAGWVNECITIIACVTDETFNDSIVCNERLWIKELMINRFLLKCSICMYDEHRLSDIRGSQLSSFSFTQLQSQSNL